MVDKEMLAAMEELLDRKLDEKLDQKFNENLKPVNSRLDRLERSVEKLDERTTKLETDITCIKVVQLENNVIPRLNTIENCYVDTSKRYLERMEQIDRMESDISVLKQIVKSHSEKLKKAQ